MPEMKRHVCADLALDDLLVFACNHEGPPPLFYRRLRHEAQDFSSDTWHAWVVSRRRS
jgi:hypothetical protein